MSKRRIMSCSLAAVLTVSLMSPASVSAAGPLDELNAVLEAAQTMEQESLLAKTLGLTELTEAFEENGLQTKVTFGLTEDTLDLMEAEFYAPEALCTLLADAYGMLNLQIDREAQKWVFEIGAGIGEESLLDAQLYGAMDMLAVSVPQFFTGAAAIGGGSFLEQYHGSVIEQYADMELPISDFNLKFFPEEGDLALKGEAAELADAIAQQAQEFENRIRVEKEETTGMTKYTLRMKTEDIKNIYFAGYDAGISLVQDAAGTEIPAYELEDVRSELEEALDQAARVIGKEIPIDFYVRDGLLTQVAYEVVIHEKDLYGSEEMIVAEDGSDAAEETGASAAVKFEYIIPQPKEPWKAFEMTVYAEESETGASIAAQVKKQTIEDETTSETTLDVALLEDGEILYSDTVFHSSYNAQTGDLNADLTFQDEISGDIVLHLDSTITPQEYGFVCTVDALEFHAEGLVYGICGEVMVSSDPGEIETPQDTRMLFKMSEGALMGLVTEISMNAENWAETLEARLMEAVEPETAGVYEDEISVGGYDNCEEIIIMDNTDDTVEILDNGVTEEGFEDIVLEEDAVYEDIIVEEIPDEETIAIIGGADGPTSIFLAGKVD